MFRILSTYIFTNREFILLLLVWLITGIFGGVLIFILLPLSLLLLRYKERYEELLLGFFFILILSDSRQPELRFASDLKEIYILMLSLILIFNRKYFTPFNNFYQKFIPFFIIAFIAILKSDVTSLSFQKTLSYILLFLIVPNYVQQIWAEKGEEFFRNLIYLGVFILLLGLILMFILPDKVFYTDRYSGVFGNPNGLGIFCFLFFLLTATVTHFYPNILSKYEKFVIYGVLFTSLILSGSRSVLLAVLIFLFFKQFYTISTYLGFIIFLTFIISYDLITSNFTQIILSLGLGEFFRIDTLESGSGRVVAWNFALENIQQNFFLGKGFEHTNHIFKQNSVALSILGHQGHAHNSFLTFWLDTGLLGLIAFVAALLLSFLKAAKNSIIALPVFYAVLFSVFFESWLTASLNPFTIQLVIILTILLSFHAVEEIRSTVPEEIKFA